MRCARGSFGSKKGSSLHPSIIGLCFARHTPESSSSHLDQMQHELAPPPASMLLALAEPRRPWVELATSKLAEALFFPNSGGIRGEGVQGGQPPRRWGRLEGGFRVLAEGEAVGPGRGGGVLVGAVRGGGWGRRPAEEDEQRDRGEERGQT